MTDAEFLLLILAGLYLVGCAVWIRPGGFLFRSQLGERHRLWTLRSGGVLRNFDGGAVLANLVPLGEAHLCEQWPLSISPDGVYGYVAHAISPDGRPVHEERFIRFDDVHSARSSGCQILINGLSFARAGSAQFASHLAQLLERLRTLPADQRGPAIETAFAATLDTEAIARRERTFRRCSAPLRLACALIFFHIFVFVPLVIYRASHINLLQVLACYFALVIMAALLFRGAHRALYPRQRADRAKQLVLMLISPADSMHARDHLARELLCEFHPLAVAHVLCPRPVYREFARCVLRDLEYPMLPLCPLDDPGPRTTEEWFRVRTEKMLRAFLQDSGESLAELLDTPQPESAMCRTYCPRCHGQYVLAEGVCTTCEGRPLVRFDQPETGAPPKAKAE